MQSPAPPSIDLRKEAENTIPTRLFKPEDPRFLTQRFEKHSSRLGPNMLAIYFDRIEEPLLLEVAKHCILGRANSDPSNAEPWVDLTPYGAYEKGVSRKHALLRRTGTQLMIEDLESSNGSFLNNLPLKPYQASPVVSGDRIRLSQLNFVVFIPG